MPPMKRPLSPWDETLPFKDIGERMKESIP